MTDIQSQVDNARAAVKDQIAAMRKDAAKQQAQAKAAVEAAEQEFNAALAVRNQLSAEIASLRQAVTVNTVEFLRDIPSQELRQAALERAYASTSIPTLAVALAEADKRVEELRRKVDNARGSYGQAVLEARIPEIWQRAEAMYPLWLALDAEVSEVAELWPADATRNMPACMPAIGALALHFRRLLPIMRAALEAQAKP